MLMTPSQVGVGLAGVVAGALWPLAIWVRGAQSKAKASRLEEILIETTSVQLNFRSGGENYLKLACVKGTSAKNRYAAVNFPQIAVGTKNYQDEPSARQIRYTRCNDGESLLSHPPCASLA